MPGQYEPTILPQTYSSVDAEAKPNVFLRGTKRERMNLVAICQNLFLPWILFSFVMGVLSFSFHYQHPGETWFAVILCLIVVLLCILAAVWTVWKRQKSGRRHYTWYVFLAVTMTIAWVAAVILGDMNFHLHMSDFYDLVNLNSYPMVDPAATHGQQVMDAGRLFFIAGTTIDLTRSMGFKNTEMYCVAPITMKNEVLANYDFWAVGLNCCSGGQSNFHCGEFNNPNARGGLRLMNDALRPFYRLAVQQAEAMFTIKAGHPIFFEWMQDPNLKMNALRDDGFRMYLLCIFSFFAFNFFCVLCMVIFSSKLGHFYEEEFVARR